MNKKQLSFILGIAIFGLFTPSFSVGLFLMGVAIGAFIAIALSD